ncbi:anhydro-N-acetylmuramic acid kinase [Belliella sp. DSM 107340]|uniref:Anhydro-N-acetylmuramic acid kinase n=1 Tax=Belliella calami TaxID=2923436 RepID=A0ABS9UMQ9_9BACT|nr:anhydro-N-acetylmuramic acid kinase [Belliella calami]MCH7397896.1 anhydro-N-acetylmuramic acid kinase [Belliella calami]
MSQQYQLIGLMSGTSGDGLDIAYCQFTKSTEWKFEILEAETIPFPEKLEKELLNAHLLSSLELNLLDVEFGRWMGEVTKNFVHQHQLEVKAIASHGHTVFHQPQKGLSRQIGNGWAMHVASGIPVINDFRMLDVQLGGQGAPLVPIGDKLLFQDFDYCINLGGIANISMEEGDQMKAFDICPFNLLLNHYAKTLKMPFDKGGNIARSGKIVSEILKKLNDHPYYHVKGAKSLGREDLDGFFEILEANDAIETNDKLRTIIAHAVHQIKLVIPNSKGKLLLTGGGAFNTFFVEELKHELGTEILIPESDPDLINFKEAMVFAFLGVLRLRNENNCLASVTGASRDSSGGMVFGLA